MAHHAWHSTIVGIAALVPFACAAPSPNEPGLYDEGSSSEDALASEQISEYAAIQPPENRIATAKLDVLLGAPIDLDRKLVAIRSLVFQGKPARLVVDSDSMTTSLVRADDLASATRPATDDDHADDAPFAKSLAELAKTHAAVMSIDPDAPSGGATEPFVLTVDMCQSRKPWERKLYEWAVELSDVLRKPTPIGIAMTGGWAKAHPDELEQIVSWERAGKLAITWINHSNTHPLHCLDESCRRAEFLTAESVDFDEEVLGLERALLARGLPPSVIFRFPGLTHDERRMQELSRLSLMALDADSWIAKGQPIKPRSVVLVHGNGNEPPGITGFLKQVESRRAALRSGTSALVSPLFVAPVPPR